MMAQVTHCRHYDDGRQELQDHNEPPLALGYEGGKDGVQFLASEWGKGEGEEKITDIEEKNKSGYPQV